MSYLEDVPKYAFGTAFNLGNGRDETPEEDFKNQLRQAIRLGLRHIDCSPTYGTQKAVGEALRQARCTIPRSEFFIASKLPVNMMRTEKIDRSIKKTLIDLQLTYLDLFLIHAPFATKYVNDNEVYPLDKDGNLMIDDEYDDMLERAWIKLIDLKERGYVKYIGLCNVNEGQLDRLNMIHQVDVVQNEYHLYNQEKCFFDHCEEVEVHYEAYAAFGNPPRAKQLDLPTYDTDPVIERIANEHNLTKAEVILQWLHKQPLSYVIRTDNLAQFEENWNAIQNITIPLNDMIDMDTLNQRARIYYFDNYRNLARHREYPFKKIVISG